jgi:hypothetical protein
MLRILLFLSWLIAALPIGAVANPQAEPARLHDAQGVKIGRITQFAAETKRDPAVERMLRQQGCAADDGPSDNPPHYFYNKVDLNGDGKPEVLVYYVAEKWCGTGGCRFFVGQMRGKSYKVIGRIIITHMPVIISDKKTRGWQDFILYASGGGLTPHYCVYEWQGNKYDDKGPAIKAGQTINGRSFISNELKPGSGIRFM